MEYFFHYFLPITGIEKKFFFGSTYEWKEMAVDV